MLKNIRWTESRAVGTSAGRVRSPTPTGAERAQGIGAVVVAVRHRSYGPAALTQQRHNLAGHAADSPAGTGHQDETRLSHRPPSFVIPAIAVKSATPPTPARERSYSRVPSPQRRYPSRRREATSPRRG